MAEYRNGDFVWYRYETDEVFPGRIIGFENGEYIIEICMNKRKSAGNDLEQIKAKPSQLELRILGVS